MTRLLSFSAEYWKGLIKSVTSTSVHAKINTEGKSTDRGKCFDAVNVKGEVWCEMDMGFIETW